MGGAGSVGEPPAALRNHDRDPRRGTSARLDPQPLRCSGTRARGRRNPSPGHAALRRRMMTTTRPVEPRTTRSPSRAATSARHGGGAGRGCAASSAADSARASAARSACGSVIHASRGHALRGPLLPFRRDRGVEAAGTDERRGRAVCIFASSDRGGRVDTPRGWLGESMQAPCPAFQLVQLRSPGCLAPAPQAPHQKGRTWCEGGSPTGSVTKNPLVGPPSSRVAPDDPASGLCRRRITAVARLFLGPPSRYAREERVDLGELLLSRGPRLRDRGAGLRRERACARGVPA